jgi:hypothetical protein
MHKLMPNFLIVCLAAAAATMSLRAQAFCALRDPVRHIQQMHGYPTDCRSLVAKIDDDVRRGVAGLLPFTLHARELGRHTLYVLTDKGAPAGYLHARSEASPWGMVEVVWSFDEELRVRAFRFQRCRAPNRDYFESAAFADWLRGQSFSDLSMTLDERALQLAEKHADRFAGNERLAITIVRSALKAIAVTEIAWGPELAERRLRAMLAKSGGATLFETLPESAGNCVVIGRDKAGAELGRAVRLLEDSGRITRGRLIAYGLDQKVGLEWTLSRPAMRLLVASPMVESKLVSDDEVYQRARLVAYGQ